MDLNVEKPRIVGKKLIINGYMYVRSKPSTATATSYGIHNCRPMKLVSAFELAIINSCRSVYSGIPVSYCFFHLGQSFYRNIQIEGLQAKYNDPNDDTIRKQSHMILS